MELSTRSIVRTTVPENAFAGDEPLVAVYRGNCVGSLHRGSVSVVDLSGKDILSIGENHQPVFLRSAAKPFQVMPAVLSGGIDRFDITERELAVLCASHHAEPRHMDAVLSVLLKIGLDESALRCGVHPPLDQKTAERRQRAGIEPSPVCNNCSGAHAGMLAACRARGWPTENYGDPDHPLQILTRQTLATFAGVDAGDIEFAMDNCAVPTFRLPLRNAALAFARLMSGGAVPADLAHTAGRVVRAMTRFPEMVGGEESFDSALMGSAGGAIVSKSGAEGFQGAGLAGRRLGIAMKITDGSSRAAPPAMIRVLEGLEALSQTQLGDLASYTEPVVLNMLGQPVGRIMPVFHFGERM